MFSLRSRFATFSPVMLSPICRSLPSALCALMLMGGATLSAQQFDRKAFEVGVVYNEPGDDVFSATTPCALDDLRFYVGWGDDANNVTEVLQAIDHPPFPNPANVHIRYNVPRHSYTAKGAHRAEITEVLHCSGGAVSNTNTSFTPVNAYDRGSVGPIQRDHNQYKAGEQVQLTINTPPGTQAAASGTRVYLTAVSGASFIDPAMPLASYLDIPPNSSNANVTFRLGKAAALKTLTIKATAKNSTTTTIKVTE
jgi:hypothetical protein